MSGHSEMEISVNALLREMRPRSSLARRVFGFLVAAILLISSAASAPGSSRPEAPAPEPLTPAETAIDDRTFVPESTVTFGFRESTINGVFYTNALVMSVHRPSRIEIDAGRSRSRFLGEFGVPDNQKSGSAYQVDVSFDNAAPVLSKRVHFGETMRLNLDVTNMLRISISISPIARSRGYVAIGNPRFR